MTMTFRSKYYNQPLDTPDGHFDSRREYARWCDLKWMQRAGQIKNLVRQQKFELIPKQRLDGRTVKECFYIADFVYEENGVVIVEDCKGVKTDVYRIKKKLMLWRYGIDIRET